MADKDPAVEAYINGFDGEAKKRMLALRQMVSKKVPEAKECISYGMPAYKLDKKPFFYFMAHKDHIGVYPGKVESYEFYKQLQQYASGKSTLKFPYSEPMPIDLIEKLIDYRLAQLAAPKE